jgi:hypothetical protein
VKPSDSRGSIVVDSRTIREVAVTSLILLPGFVHTLLNNCGITSSNGVLWLDQNIIVICGL